MSPLIRLSNLEQFAAVNLNADLGDEGGPVIVPQCAQIVFKWVLDGGRSARNVLYGRYTGAFAGTPAQALAISNALSTGAAFTALRAVLASTTAFWGVSIRDVNTKFQPEIVPTFSGINGTGTGAALPNEVAACVTVRTALAGKQNRGRVFLPGFESGQLAAGNIIGPAAVTAINNWAATWTSAFAASGYTFVIGQKHRVAYTSPKTGVDYPDRPANSVQVVSAVLRDNHWDSQRRRGLK